MVSQSLRSDARCCDASRAVSLCLPKSLRSDARCCDAGSGVVSPACLPISPSLCDQMPDAVTPAQGSCLPLGSLSPSLSTDAVTLTAGSCLPLVSLCLARSLLSDARCCDAGCGVVSPACLPVSPSLCDQMPDAVTPAQGSCLPLVSLSPSLSIDAVTLTAGSCLPLVSLCLARSLRSDARCCDAPVSPSLCGQMLDVVSPTCPLCFPVSAVRCRVSRLPPCLPVSHSKARCCDCGVSLCLSRSLRSGARSCDAGSGSCLLSPSLCGWLFV